MALGKIAGARRAYQESLETFRKNGENSKSAYPRVGMGDVYAASGDFADAKKSYEEALQISREAGEKQESAVALANLGSLLMQQGDLTGACENYQEAMKLRNEIGEKSGAAEISLLLASWSIEEEHPSEGEALGRKALEEFRAAKMSELQISAHAILAQALLAQGELNLAQKEIAMGKTAGSEDPAAPAAPAIRNCRRRRVGSVREASGSPGCDCVAQCSDPGSGKERHSGFPRRGSPRLGQSADETWKQGRWARTPG
jgi:tetratricopeptide (TPR) repeat protein